MEEHPASNAALSPTAKILRKRILFMDLAECFLETPRNVDSEIRCNQKGLATDSSISMTSRFSAAKRGAERAAFVSPRQ
jgi:hypothetical protein